MGNPNNFVPDHIVEAILLKLPVRSLFRFKAVSNSFLSLISSPRFVSAHYQPSNALPSSIIFQSGRKIFEYGSRRTPPPVCHVVDLVTKKRQVLDLPPLDGTLELVGCANGLVCIRILCLSGNGDEEKFILWNPATKQYRHVIPCPSYPSTIILAVVGFGYDPRIEDYKLFSLPGVRRTRTKYKPKVLQLRRGTCREIHGLPYDIYYHYSSPVVIAGVWYQVRRTDSGPKILYFDLKEESFALIDPPINLDEFSAFKVALGLRDQKLCVFAMSKYNGCRGWMMEKEATWTEMFTINVCSTIGTPVAGDDFRLHSTWRGTTIVLENFQSVYAVGIIPGTTLHDSLTLRFEEILEIERKTFLYGAFDFVESLVSPILLEA